MRWLRCARRGRGAAAYPTGQWREARPGGAWHNAASADAPSQSQNRQMGYHRLLRHPDRLGEGDHRRRQERGGEGRLQLRRGSLPRPLHGGPGRNHGRLLRALRRGPAPHDRQGRRRAGLGDRALARPVPAQQRRLLAALPRGQRGDGPARQEATRSGSSPTSTTNCSASPAATCAPNSTSSSPRSRSAATSPTPSTSKSARGGSAARKAGCTSAATTPTTSRRC